MHPNLLDPDGITTATLTQIPDYIVAERDAGRIHVASPYDMYLLDVA